MRVLHLAPHMKMGHGVSEVVAAISQEWGRAGIFTAAGCLEQDGHFTDFPIHRVEPDPVAVADLAARLQCRVVIAHGSPYFEVLPGLPGWFTTIAYEHGDPTPEMFPDEATGRRLIVEHKQRAVYPRLSGVIAISEFIRQDINWPAARVIRSGVNHIPDEGTKELVPPVPGQRALRVGTLMRLGRGEAKYKGTGLLPAVREAVAELAPDVRFEVMGRGTEEDAAELRAQGFTVHLNATNDERSSYLRELDVFVSPSLWEGMNLPLVEAQALGTPGLALDTGAHPEFTPLVFDSIKAVADQISAYDSDRDLLARHGRACYHYVRDNLDWRLTADQVAAFARECAAADSRKGTIAYRATRLPAVRKARRRLGRYRREARSRVARVKNLRYR